MDLHGEVPLVTLLRLMHLGIALPGLVLRRVRRMDDRRIDHRAAIEQQATLLQQLTELADHRLVGHRIIGQIQTRKETSTQSRTAHLNLPGMPLCMLNT